MDIKKLQDKILEICKNGGYTHIGSCLSVLPILIEIYQTKKNKDIVILDNAHAHVAHAVVKHAFGELPSDPTIGIERNGIHCDIKSGCDASGGSLGHGLGIGIGYAITHPQQTVYVVLSEGSTMEGSTYEALRMLNDFHITNVSIHLNFNGYSAVAVVDGHTIAKRMIAFYPRITQWFTDNGKGFEGIEGHYIKL